jgi:hypothetical protein
MIRHVKSRRRPKLRLRGSHPYVWMVVPLAAEVVVHPLPVSLNEPVRIHADVGALVVQELPFTVAVINEEKARRCGADMCRR